MRAWIILPLFLAGCSTITDTDYPESEAALIICVLASCETVISDRTEDQEEVEQTEETELEIEAFP